MARLIDHLRDPSPSTIDADLADQVRFRSPFTDYLGRADVAHLVGLIGGVLDEVHADDVLADGARTFSRFAARVGGEEVQGLLYERRDGTGRVAEAMLTVRPYAGLRAAMRAMQRALEESPLPGVRS